MEKVDKNEQEVYVRDTAGYILSIVKNYISRCDSKIDDFRNSLIEDSIIYATSWKLTDALEAESSLKILKPLVDEIVNAFNPDHSTTVDDLKDEIEELLYESEYFLIRGGLWNPNSVSAMSNVRNLCEGNSHRKLHEIFSKLLREIDLYKELESKTKED